jgi:hypothetical protein
LYNVTSLHSEVVLPPLPDKTGPFKGEDYEAPTSYITPQPAQKTSPTSDPPTRATQSGKVPPRSKQKKRGVPVVSIISVIIIILVFVIGSMAYSIYQALDRATITITPRVETLKTTITLTAKQGTNVDSNVGIIPSQMLSSSKSASKSKETTGRNCTLLPLRCDQAVAEDDIHNLVTQIQPDLRSQIAQDLRQQAQAQGGTPFGDIVYMNETNRASPSVGTTSKTVIVTLTLQGSQEYIKNADARTVAVQQLRGKVKQNYSLIPTTVQTGQPVVQSVDKQGNALISVPVGAVIRYTITENDISSIKTLIVGKDKQQAPGLIRTQNPNLDPEKIRVQNNYGNTLPGDGERIDVKPTDPANMPPVQL